MRDGGAACPADSGRTRGEAWAVPGGVKKTRERRKGDGSEATVAQAGPLLLPYAQAAHQQEIQADVYQAGRPRRAEGF